jgi:hypothetical protein
MFKAGSCLIQPTNNARPPRSACLVISSGFCSDRVVHGPAFYTQIPSKLAAERPVHLERVDDVGDGTGGGGDGDEEARDAERLEADPSGAATRHAALLDVHLNGEVDGERPEGDGAEEPRHVAEEGQQHGDDGGDAHERRPPREAERAEGERAGAELPRDEGAVRPGRGGAALDEGEDGLAEHLVRAHEVHHDGHVGHVQQPEGLVEAEAGEQVVGRVVAERRVPHAPAQHVEHGRRRHAEARRLLHHLRLRRWRRLDRVLSKDRSSPGLLVRNRTEEGIKSEDSRGCGCFTWISMRMLEKE